MTSILEHMYIDKLGGMVIKYNKTYHRTAKMNPVNVRVLK